MHGISVANVPTACDFVVISTGVTARKYWLLDISLISPVGYPEKPHIKVRFREGTNTHTQTHINTTHTHTHAHPPTHTHTHIHTHAHILPHGVAARSYDS